MNHKTVVLNAAKMNFDGNLDFSVLSEDVTVYDDTDQHQLLARIQGAAVVVTKEMPVGGDLIRQFPDSVKLICEAGHRIQQSGSGGRPSEGDHGLQHPGIQLQTGGPYGCYDDPELKLIHAAPDENAGPWLP